MFPLLGGLNRCSVGGDSCHVCSFLAKLHILTCMFQLGWFNHHIEIYRQHVEAVKNTGCFGECFAVVDETTTWTMDSFKDHKRKHEIRILSLTSQYDIKCKNELFLSTVWSGGLMSNCMLNTYLEPKWPVFWLEFGPCFEGLTFKHRGHLGSIGINIYIYVHIYITLLC